jgi:hypothetical protein
MDGGVNPHVKYAKHFHPICLGLPNANKQNIEDHLAMRLSIFAHFLKYVQFEDEQGAPCQQQI